MFFGEVSTLKAAGAILAHGAGAFKKGHILRAVDCEALSVAGIHTLSIARLENGDIGEDEAALRLAAHLPASIRVGEATTGRVNLFAAHDGLFITDVEGVNHLNASDESITLATLKNFSPVKAGDMVGTFKIIPYAVREELLHTQVKLEVKPFTRLNIALIQTMQPKTLAKVIDKTVRVTRERVEALGGKLIHSVTGPHDAEALKTALKALPAHDILVIFGASAISDRRDVLPASIDQIIHLGMPVDPGNLLMIGRHKGKPVIGAPGCARSSKENGFDWVLQRLMAAIEPENLHLNRLGVGGLLTEIKSRPTPRMGKQMITGLILAAGKGSRMGQNKMLTKLNKKPLLHYVIDAAENSDLDSVVIITGHEEERVRGSIHKRNFHLPLYGVGEALKIIHNEEYEQGLATSLKLGVETAAQADGVVVLLGDMPFVSNETINKLIAAFSAKTDIIVPTYKGEIGNPVLWGSSYFQELATLKGDKGAKAMLEKYSYKRVEIEDNSVFIDIDTPEMLKNFER